MTIGRITIACLLGFCLSSAQSKAQERPPENTLKQVKIIPKISNDYEAGPRVLPSEEEQEEGNAVPVLLRIIYEQTAFMKDVYPRLHEFAEMDVNDPRLKELYFDRFAEQIIRAGSMSDADWQYPIRSDRPYMILLPDMQSQRELVGRGMTGWIRKQLSEGKTDKALEGIKAQIACGRHCADSPIVICHLVGMAIANLGLDNLELAIQSDDCPNMYWALAALPPTLQDLGPMVRWELMAAPAGLKEPLPAIGSDEWQTIANRFVELYSEASSESYTREEGEALQVKLEALAREQLSSKFGFVAEDVERMTKEEKIMRWIHLKYLQFRSHVEPLAYQSIKQVLAAKTKVEVDNKELLELTGAKSSPFPVSLPHEILGCRYFERRVKFIQTVEAIRDYASRHNGALPASLADLIRPAPNDPFTEQPFLYEVSGKKARLRQASIENFSRPSFDFELTVK